MAMQLESPMEGVARFDALRNVYAGRISSWFSFFSARKLGRGLTSLMGTFVPRIEQTSCIT